MTDRAAKIRLYVDAALGAGQGVVLGGQAHYVVNVMRQGPGDLLLLFNGRDGEWSARIAEANKRRVLLEVVERTAPQADAPDIWLLFAPIKKARTDFIVEKATEMGVARILPVLTRYTNAERVRTDRLRAHAIEAAEQCGGTFLPGLAEPARLEQVLDAWPEDRKLMFCDEGRQALPVARALAGQGRGPWAILIGPEGGFSPDEATRLRAMQQVVPVTLGPRILRADTAAVAALAAWQLLLGDWDAPA